MKQLHSFRNRVHNIPLKWVNEKELDFSSSFFATTITCILLSAFEHFSVAKWQIDVSILYIIIQVETMAINSLNWHHLNIRYRRKTPSNWPNKAG